MGVYKKQNPERFQTIPTTISNVVGGVSSTYTQGDVDMFTSRHVAGNDYSPPVGIVLYDDGVVLAAQGDDFGIVSFFNTTTARTDAAFKDAASTGFIKDIFDDGSNIYTVGQDTSTTSYVQKFGRGGTFVSGKRFTTGAGATHDTVYSDGTNIFSCGSFDSGGLKSFIIKLDTDLALSLGKSAAGDYGTFRSLTSDGTNLYFSNNAVINSYLKSDLTLVGDKTLTIDSNNLTIGGVLVDGSNLVCAGYDTSNNASIVIIQSDLGGVGAGALQDSGTDVKINEVIKHGSNYFCIGTSTESDTRAVILEFNSSLELQNAKTISTVSGLDMRGDSLISDGTDIYIAMSDSLVGAGASTNPILRIKNADLSGGSLTSDNPVVYTFEDYTITFASATPALADVTQTISTGYSPSLSVDTAVDIDKAQDVLTPFT